MVEVFLDGKKVDDVTTHPAYKNAVAAAARLYDFQADPENIEWMTFESPTSGERVNRCWQLTKSYEELVARRQAIEGWSRLSGGWLGRSPDHIASSMVGQVMGCLFSKIIRKNGLVRLKITSNTLATLITT